MSPKKKKGAAVKVLCSNCEKILVPVDQNVIEVQVSSKKSDDDEKGPEESEEMSDAEKKKRNQRREDISVYITMGGIKYFKRWGGKDYSKKVRIPKYKIFSSLRSHRGPEN